MPLAAWTSLRMESVVTVKLSIWLSDEQDAFGRSLVDSGRYSSVGGVFDAGLDLLHEKVAEEDRAKRTFRAKIERRSREATISAGVAGLRRSCIARKRRVTSFAAKRDPNRCPTHPGAFLRDYIVPAIGKPRIRRSLTCWSSRGPAP